MENLSQEDQYQLMKRWLIERQWRPYVSKEAKRIGNFKNNGKEWQAKGQEMAVNVHEYLPLADGKAVPFGIYDMVEFAGESIRRWQSRGSKLYPASE